MYTLLKHNLNRNVIVINLDPANDNVPYNAQINLTDLITVEEVMQQFDLGPNGALMYCMEVLEKNMDWLLQRIEKDDYNYFLFDCPGQTELYTHHNSIKNIMQTLEQNGMRLCVVNLIDSHYCSEAHKYISALLLSLNTMLQIGLPHINCLSKADQLKRFKSKLEFNVDFYTDVLDLKYLLNALDEDCYPRYRKMNRAIVSLVEDYSLVSFHLLESQKKESLVRIKNTIDKTNGFVFNTTEETTIHTMLSSAMAAKSETERYQSEIDPYI